MRRKKLFLGVFTTTLILGSTLNLYAKTESINIPVKYNNIKILVDGKEISIKNEPFIYNGATYLPVRDIAIATGKDINWNEDTKTINIISKVNLENQNNIQISDNRASVNFGELSINIRDDFHITKDYKGRDAICIKYDFTNYNDEAISFNLKTNNKVFQNGVELEKTFVSYDAIDNQYNESSSKYIQKGTTILVGEFYLLNDKNSDITVEVKELFNFYEDGKKVTKTLKITN